MRIVRSGVTRPGPNGTKISICKLHEWCSTLSETGYFRTCLNCGRVEERNKDV